jgi:hypothetical protein
MYPVDTIKTRMQALSHPGQRVSPGGGGRPEALAALGTARVTPQTCCPLLAFTTLL